MTPAEPRPTVVVVNYGSHALLRANLATLPGPLIVVDNFSTDTERSAVTELCDDRSWTLLPQPDNRGFAAAVNAGVAAAEQAGATEVVLINPDAVVPADVLDALGRQLRDEPMTLVSPRIVNSAGASYFHGSRVVLGSGRMRSRPRPGPDTPAVLYPESEAGLRDWISGACMAFSVALWRAAGGWDERYFLYWEDVDFSQRCVTAGGRLCVRNDLLVVHDEGGTHGEQLTRVKSNVYYYFNCRNRLLYARFHLGRGDRWRWALRTPAESVQILLRGGKRQILTSPGTLWSAVRGSLAGIGRLAGPAPQTRR